MSRRRRGGAARLLLVVALLAAAGCAAERGGTASPPPDIVLVIVDTWRWDALGANAGAAGDASPTPHLDRLAGRGVRFTRAFANSPWTQPSVASLLTGLHPTVHGAHGRLADVAPIRRAVPLVTETLAAAGYRTVAVVNGFFLSPKLGFDRGFEVYDYFASSNLDVRRAGASVDAALSHVAPPTAPGDRAAGDERPVFLLLHLFDPHLAYDPPAPWRDRASPSYAVPFADLRGMRLGTLGEDPEHLAHIRRLYEGEVSYVDQEVGRLVERLEAERPGRERLVIVTADHGEELGDHGGWEHGHSMYQELLRVPLLILPPASRPASASLVEAQVRLLDLAPTMLDAAGVSAAPIGTARSLFAWFEESPRREDLTVFAERVHLGPDAVALRDGRHTLIYLPGEERVELYDQRDDPLERSDLAALDEATVRRLRRRLQRIVETLRHRADLYEEAEPAIELTPEEIERLRALGYVGG